ncbi:MAG: hypothetical protein GY703_08970 [Gammaproteobacteria bacterium]|nr:hypothetical protein [Gammaproteobacteria bacterium]
MISNFAYSQLLKILGELIRKRETGVIFIRSQCNHSISFAFNEGHIKALSFGPRRGTRAIPLIRDIEGGTYRFDGAAYVDTLQNLPATDEIMSQLQPAAPAADNAAAEASAEPGEPVVPETSWAEFGEETRTLLTDYLGPIADVIFDEIVEEIGGFYNTETQARTLIGKLAVDIEDTQLSQFQEKAENLIRKTLAQASG